MPDGKKKLQSNSLMFKPNSDPEKYSEETAEDEENEDEIWYLVLLYIYLTILLG